MPRRVALFGGSFNPPHVGHVLNAAWVLSCVDVDELWVVPTWQHAFGKALAPWEDRLEMVRRAFEPLGPRVRLCEVERELGGESRTIRMVEHLLRKEPELELTLVVGSDILAELDRWLEVERLLTLVRLVVLRRGGHPSDDPRVVGPVIPEVSSTHLRGLLARGELSAAEGLVPRRVLEVIAERGLYRATERGGDDVDAARRVLVIGAGRAGLSLALGMDAAGHTVVGCWSRSRSRAEDAAARFGEGCVALSGPLGEEALPEADVVLLAVVDEAIGQVAAELVLALGAGRLRETVVLHTSGSLGASVLVESGVPQARAGSLHPLVALPDARAVGSHVSAERLRGAFVAVEGGDEAAGIARALGEAVGATVVTLRPGRKALYHAAAVLLSNFAVTLFGAAERLLVEEAGISPRPARAMLVALLESAVRNVAAVGPVEALTGPIRRGDVATVATHLEAFEAGGANLAQIEQIYRSLVVATVALARESGLDAERAASLVALVDGR